MAFVRLSIPVSFLAQADELAKSIPEVLECHHLTGSDGVILKVIVSSVGHLEEVISKMGSCGMTTTAIVLSSPVVSRPIDPVKQPAGASSSKKFTNKPQPRCVLKIKKPRRKAKISAALLILHTYLFFTKNKNVRCRKQRPAETGRTASAARRIRRTVR